ncbi:hypothetical protein PVAND_015480 [Polypedilum vanderplanki]|uniref:DNA 3'-5' helicase n=1 Tax=Polypedilum vanderplanki TaxID=319348 RepID=A0A9J6BCQ0_POLVA|nr:hypothetical protein PVAND_015480 [Polypedilum vanderplanki]
MEQSDKEISQPTNEHLQVLKKLNLKTFKPEQWQAIQTIINERRDVILTAGTNYGKSLIYQFIPIFLKKKCIIIEPTEISLETSAWKLEQKGFSTSIFSTKFHESFEENQFIFTKAENVQKIYEILIEKDSLDEICLIAIEEISCNIFDEIELVKKFFPSISSPLLLLSTTIDEELKIDLKCNLFLNNPLNIQIDLNRPNLEYFVHKENSTTIDVIRAYLEEVKEGSGIIFAEDKREIENILRKMQENGFQAKPFHFGIFKQERSKTLNEFMSGKLKFLIAMTGMVDKIDKKDVRLVLHVSAPNSLEVYYRETGKAGRDGKPSKCVLFWTPRNSDQWLQQEYLKNQNVSQIIKMKNFTSTETCRREILLRFLDSEFKRKNLNLENCCDNCKKIIFEKVSPNLIFEELNSDGIFDASKETRIMLKIINSYKNTCQEEFLYGMLLGKKPKVFNSHHPLHLFRSGYQKPRDWHVYLKKILLNKRFIIETENDKILKLTKIGKFILRHSNIKIKIKPSFEICYKFMTKTENEFYIDNNEIKSKPRKIETETLKVEIPKRSFQFGFLKNTLKRVGENIRKVENCEEILSSEDSIKKLKSEDQPGCSHWNFSKVQQNSKIENEIDDENIQNFLEINRQIRKRNSVTSINEFLNYIEKFGDEFFNIEENLENYDEGNENETMECI